MLSRLVFASILLSLWVPSGFARAESRADPGWLGLGVLEDADLQTRLQKNSRWLDPEEGLGLLDEGPSVGGLVSVVPAAAFSSDGVSPRAYTFEFPSGLLRGGPNVCLKARVHLRDHIDIESLGATVLDNDPGVNLLMFLYRKPFDDGTDAEVVTGIATTGAVGTPQHWVSTTVNFPTVNQDLWVYYLGVCMNSFNVGLLAVRIVYATDIFADGFESGDTTAWSAVAP